MSRTEAPEGVSSVNYAAIARFNRDQLVPPARRRGAGFEKPLDQQFFDLVLLHVDECRVGIAGFGQKIES